jgi:hypothetical protein
MLAGGGTIVLYDVRGRQVRELSARSGRAEWDGSDSSGRALPAGVYFATYSPSGPSGDVAPSKSGALRVVLVR